MARITEKKIAAAKAALNEAQARCTARTLEAGDVDEAVAAYRKARRLARSLGIKAQSVVVETYGGRGPLAGAWPVMATRIAVSQAGIEISRAHAPKTRLGSNEPWRRLRARRPDGRQYRLHQESEGASRIWGDV